MCDSTTVIPLNRKQMELLHSDIPFMKVDKCISLEIERLIVSEVRTLECCCGHGKKKPWALIMAESHDKAIDMGYDPKKVADGIYKIELKG